MTTARRTVEDPNGDITVGVDSVDFGDGACDAPFVKLVSATESSAELIPGTAADGLLVNLGANNDVTATGNIASGSSDSGNPVKVGGRYNSTKPTLTDGQHGDAQLGTRGSTHVTMMGQDTTFPTFQNAGADGDGMSAATTAPVRGNAFLWNGTGWDRARGDITNGLDVDVTRVGGTVAVTQSGTWDEVGINDSGNVITIDGEVAAGVAVSGNPIQVAARAESTVPSAVDDGDVVLPWATLEGAQVVTFNRTRTAALVPTIDTAVYADLDRLGSVVTVTGAGLRNGGSGMIVNAMLVDDAVSNFSIEAWFFQVTPTMVNADNGVFDISDANIATAVPLGVIDFWSANTKAMVANRITPGTYLGGPCALHYTCAAADSAIYMILRARGAYDAAATDDINIYLDLIRY